MKVDSITKIITYPMNNGTHVRMVKKREGCETEIYGGCQYMCLKEDKTDKIIALCTCRHHSGIEQYTQNSYPNYYNGKENYPV